MAMVDEPSRLCWRQADSLVSVYIYIYNILHLYVYNTYTEYLFLNTAFWNHIDLAGSKACAQGVSLTVKELVEAKQTKDRNIRLFLDSKSMWPIVFDVERS